MNEIVNYCQFAEIQANGDLLYIFIHRSQVNESISNSQYVTASVLCEAISSLKYGIASTEEHRLAMTWFKLRIAVEFGFKYLPSRPSAQYPGIGCRYQ